MRGWWFGVGPLVAVVVVAGCASSAPAAGATSSPLIEGLLADSDDQGLVATYTGGACDGPARLAVTETSSRIDIDVRVEPDPKGPRECSAQGISRTVTASLAQPVGERPIFSGAQRHVPFDGSRRLVPSALPLGFTQSAQRSGSEPDSAPAVVGTAVGGAAPGLNTVRVTTRWGVTYTEPVPDPDTAASRCAPSRGTVMINVGPANTDDVATGWLPTATASVGGHPARLLRGGPASTPTGWAYVWEANHGTVEVLAQARCAGDRVLSPTELLTVAESLGPT